MKKSMLRKAPIAIVAVTLGTFLFSGLVMLLWNSILTAVLHVGAITIWQAAGILLLSKILFGGFGRKHRRWHRHNWQHQWKRAHCADSQTINS